MKIKPEIFKTYDIRGIVPSELNSEIAEKIGNATAVFLGRAAGKNAARILVCRDVRNSSKDLQDALIRGILKQGSSILDIGFATTPFFYFLMHSIKADGGVMVTASHNPAEFNGFKIRGKGGRPVSLGKGLEEIRRLVIFPKQIIAVRPGSVSRPDDFRDKYFAKLANGIKISSISAVVDASGASSTVFLPEFLARFRGFTYKPLFFTPDGSFKKHPPNPLLPESQKYAKKELQKGGFRFGAIFDADGDRVIFLDEKGEVIPAEFIGGLFMLEELKRNSRGSFIFSANTSRGVREYIKEQGGKVFLSKVGYVSIQDAMHRRKAAIGTETSGHFNFREMFSDDDAIRALLRLAAILSKTAKPLSVLVKPFKRYISQGEINFPVRADKKELLRRVEKFFGKSGAKISLLDGVSIEYEDWWFNLRPSNTEPIIRLVLEAKSKELYDEKLAEIKKFLI